MSAPAAPTRPARRPHRATPSWRRTTRGSRRSPSATPRRHAVWAVPRRLSAASVTVRRAADADRRRAVGHAPRCAPSTTNGTSSLTWLTVPSKSDRMSTSMCAMASVGGILQSAPSGTTATVGCARDRPRGRRRRCGPARSSRTGIAVGCSTCCVAHDVEELLDLLLHHLDELRGRLGLDVDGNLANGLSDEHGHARGRRDRRVHRDRVEPGREHQQRHGACGVGIDARRGRPAACRPRSRSRRTSSIP